MRNAHDGESTRERQRLLDEIRRCLEERDGAGLLEACVDLHPSDLADVVEDVPEEDRPRVFEILPTRIAARTLAEIERDRHPERMLAVLSPERAGAIVEELAVDDAVDLLGALPIDVRARILRTQPPGRSRALAALLRHDADSAGGLMTTEVVALPPELGPEAALDEIRRQARDLREPFYSIFVVEDGGRLVGAVGLKEIVLATADRTVGELAVEPPVAIAPDAGRDEVIRRLRRYDVADLAVVSEEGRLLGRITWDDVMDAVDEAQTEDILRLGGTDPDEEVRGGWGHAVKTRLPWLLVNLGTGSLAAAVVFVFQGTIDRVVVLATVMPVVAALGGNAGTQALAVTIRRLAVEGGERAGRARVAAKELLVGLANGAAIGVVVGLAGMLWRGDATFGLVVLAAMWGSLVVASVAGAIVPIVLEELGADPAVASSVFVTTFTDLAGFFFLLGLASLVLV